MARSVSRSEFEAAVADSAASPAFHEQYARFIGLQELMNVETMIHDGNLRIKGSWQVPALCTLVTGNIDVENTVDLKSHYDRAGLFIVIGTINCRNLIGDHALTAFIDGDLVASDAVVTGFSDCALSVIGTLATKLYIGGESAAHVGAGALVEYGVGTFAPIGEYGVPPYRPQHDEAATAKLVVPKAKPGGVPFEAEVFAGLIREGKPVFR